MVKFTSLLWELDLQLALNRSKVVVLIRKRLFFSFFVFSISESLFEKHTHTHVTDLQNKITIWLTGLLSCIKGESNQCPESLYMGFFCCFSFSFFFFYSNWQFFATVWKRLQQEGAPCSTAWRTDGKAEQRWLPGRKDERERVKRNSCTKTHAEIQQTAAHTVPMKVIQGVCVKECVFMSFDLCHSARSCQICLHALVCLMRPTKFSWTPHKHAHWFLYRR